jgi:hypothetical protein
MAPIIGHLQAIYPATSIPGSHPKWGSGFSALFVRFSGIYMTIGVVVGVVLHFFISHCSSRRLIVLFVYFVHYE